jgi:hypothetical protein
MTGLALVVLSHALLPIRDAADLEHRYELAAAIVDVTADEREQRLLLSIARHEGSFDPRVTRCERKGDRGAAVTAWQMHLFGPARSLVCRDVTQAARHALWMVRASLRECAHLPERERLSLFTSGSCDRGHVASRRRWVE